MTTKTLCECGHEISQHSYSENFTGCDIEKCDCDLDIGLFVDKQSVTIANLTAQGIRADIQIDILKDSNSILTAHNESMQADAVNNTATINMLMAQLAEVNEENRGLRQMLHMEAK